mgnify:CR=1 FL=1
MTFITIAVLFSVLNLLTYSDTAASDAHAVLDISGGDSFTDLYGPWRFRAILAPKQIAIRARKPLIMLPQTIGPFESKAAVAAARRRL